jgi:hypothetical protein
MVETPATTQAAPARPFRFGWIVLGVAAFVVLLGAGARAGIIRDDVGSCAIAFIAAGRLAVAAEVAALVIRLPSRPAQYAVLGAAA